MGRGAILHHVLPKWGLVLLGCCCCYDYCCCCHYYYGCCYCSRLLDWCYCENHWIRLWSLTEIGIVVVDVQELLPVYDVDADVDAGSDFADHG